MSHIHGMQKQWGHAPGAEQYALSLPGCGTSAGCLFRDAAGAARAGRGCVPMIQWRRLRRCLKPQHFGYKLLLSMTLQCHSNFASSCIVLMELMPPEPLRFVGRPEKLLLKLAVPVAAPCQIHCWCRCHSNGKAQSCGKWCFARLNSGDGPRHGAVLRAGRHCALAQGVPDPPVLTHRRWQPHLTGERGPPTLWLLLLLLLQQTFRCSVLFSSLHPGWC